MKRLLTKHTISISCIIAVVITSSWMNVTAEPGNLLSRIEDRYRQSAQTDVEFLHVVVSDFFETADTVSGAITFDSSGRYRTQLGDDIYLFDGACLWEYSALYSQATRNCLQTGQRIEDSFLFFTRFSDYYTIVEEHPDSLYKLRILSDRKGDAPDSLVVEVSKVESRILELRYYDINDELNVAHLVNETSHDQPDTSAFSASFPDSTEMILIHD